MQEYTLFVFLAGISARMRPYVYLYRDARACAYHPCTYDGGVAVAASARWDCAIGSVSKIEI